MPVEERLEGADAGQLIIGATAAARVSGVDQIGGEHERSRRVMSKKHVDS
jgi:hypothetical protein